MKTLFLCNTNYQLIVAIQIAKALKKEASIVLTNEIKNVHEICERLEQEQVFEIVSTMDVKTPLSSATILKRCVFGWFPRNLKGTKFDEFVGFNMDIPSHFIYAALYGMNKNIVVNKMEEGLLSYNTPETTCRVLETAYSVRKLFGKRNLKNEIGKFYCFLPSAYNGGYQSVAIPKIKKGEKIVEILNSVFLDKPIADYRGEYIFLSCIYDIEGGEPIGEFDLACRIADQVGKENLIVKVHPRDNVQKYVEAGLNVDVNSGIPWEVIQLNLDFSEKVLITTLSGSILNFNPVLEKVGISYYAYPLCNLLNNPLAQHYRDVLNAYLENRDIGLREIYLLNDLEKLNHE